MKKKCLLCGKYMSNVADKGQMPMWECYDHGSFDGEWNEVTP